jgi:thiamine-phosphate pyrophosphorylase
MAASPVLSYITDRRQFAGDEPTRRARLLEKIRAAATAGVDFIQLREKDLAARELEELGRAAMDAIGKSLGTSLLVNSRTDVALAVGAHGVHLRADDVPVSVVRQLWAGAHTPKLEREARNWITVSCHTDREVQAAKFEGADFALFAPVFEKRDVPGARATGIVELRQACSHGIPVLALGGVTLENARDCMNAGAAGIAGIRLFQENDIADVVRKLRTR